MTSGLSQYVLDHSDLEPGYLRDLADSTNREMDRPLMMSSHLQGLFLKFLANAIRPGRVLEIGTFTGYSALSFAAGLPEDSAIDTIEVDPRAAKLAAEFIGRTPYGGRINIIVGDAREIVPGLRHAYGLVFIDGHKAEYPAYYKAVFDKVPAGGYIVADNALWGGKVADDAAGHDERTRGIAEFNACVQRDGRVENFILPVRDGLMIIRKRQ